MQLERRQHGEVVVLTISGEFDAYDLPAVAARFDHLEEEGRNRIVLDLGALKFVSSSALGFLVRTKKALGAKGGDLVLARPSLFAAKVMSVLGLDELFAVFPEPEAAVRHLGGGEETSADTLLGQNTLHFRLQDEAGQAISGPDPLYGKVGSIYADGLTFRYPVPAAGAAEPLHAESFGELMAPGRSLAVRFRMPFTARARFLDADCVIRDVIREPYEEDGSVVDEARIRVTFRRILEEDRVALAALADDHPNLRRELT